MMLPTNLKFEAAAELLARCGWDPNKALALFIDSKVLLYCYTFACMFAHTCGAIGADPKALALFIDLNVDSKTHTHTHLHSCKLFLALTSTCICPCTQTFFPVFTNQFFFTDYIFFFPPSLQAKGMIPPGAFAS